MTQAQPHPLKPDLLFSYSQFYVYDSTVKSPACLWTEAHSRQGFARRELAITIGTLLEFGTAEILVHFETPTSFPDATRVLSIPISISSGKMNVDGPEEYPATHSISINPGNYLVTVAQRVTGPTSEHIDVFMEPNEDLLRKSQIIIADEFLDPLEPLLEASDPVSK